MIDKKSNNFTRYKKSDFLPTSKEEMEALGWDQADVIIFSGDAYVDHPSFGSAVIGRILQAEGYKVAIVLYDVRHATVEGLDSRQHI